MTILNKPFARTVLILILLIQTLGATLPAANDIKMKNGDFIKTILLTGSLQAAKAERFVVPTTQNWRIQIKWMVKEGDFVKPGDPVVRFDTANLASEKENIQMTLRDKEESRVQKINDFNFQKFELEVKLKQAEINLKKCEIDASIPKGLETNHDYDNKQLALKQSKQAFADAQVEKDVKLGALTSEIERIEIEIKEERSKLDKIQTQLESLVLIAKTAGTLVYGINRWEDRKVAVDDTVFATMTVATIPASDSLQVEAWMNETAVLFLRTGHHVNVRLDAYPDRIFKGVVQDVLNSAESRRMWGRSHYFSVIIKLDTLDQTIMKPGMSVLCQVEVARQKDVWLIPLQAVQFDGQGFSLTPKGQKKISVNALGFNEFYLALDKKEAAAKGFTADTLLLEPMQTETPIFLKELPNEKNNPIYLLTLVLVPMIILFTAVSCSNQPEIRQVKVLRGPFYIKIHAIGQLKSTNSTFIGCPGIPSLWNYTIDSMVQEGKEVKAGDLILSFNAKELMERWELKKSELDTVTKELEKNRLVEQETFETIALQLSEMRVQKEKATQKANQPDEFVAMNEVKKLRMELELTVLQESLAQRRLANQKTGMNTRIRALESKIKRLQLEVNDLQKDIQKMRVKAPRPGMVVYATDWRGRKKAVGDSCWVGAQIMELPDLKQMEVAAVIPEPLAGKIKTELTAEIRLDSNPDKMYRGRVKSLGRIFRTKSEEQPAMVFDAVVAVLDPNPEHMRPGMAASVDIIIDAKQNVLQIPEAAIIYHEKGLFVLQKSLTGNKRIPITIGARSAGLVEVLEGLSEGQSIIIRGQGGEKI